MANWNHHWKDLLGAAVNYIKQFYLVKQTQQSLIKAVIKAEWQHGIWSSQLIWPLEVAQDVQVQRHTTTEAYS